MVKNRRAQARPINFGCVMVTAVQRGFSPYLVDHFFHSQRKLLFFISCCVFSAHYNIYTGSFAYNHVYKYSVDVIIIYHTFKYVYGLNDGVCKYYFKTIH